MPNLPAYNRPRVSTTVKPVTNGRPQLISRDKLPAKRLSITSKDITDGAGNVHPEALARVLRLIVDHVSDSTSTTRNDPLGVKCVLQSVALTANKQSDLKHTLGEPWRYAYVLGATHGSATCTLTAAKNPTIDQSKYASVVPTGSGTYDICIVAGV